jgi:hypothetical protein
MLKSIVLAAMLFAGSALAAEADPFTGVWANANYQSSGGKQGQRLTITVRGDEDVYQSELFGAKGDRSILAFTVRYDNKPVEAASFLTAPDGTIAQREMQVVARHIDGGRRIVEHIRGGKVVRRLTRSRQGNTLISEMEDFDAQGKVTNTAHLVFNADNPKP